MRRLIYASAFLAIVGVLMTVAVAWLSAFLVNFNGRTIWCGKSSSALPRWAFDFYPEDWGAFRVISWPDNAEISGDWRVCPEEIPAWSRIHDAPQPKVKGTKCIEDARGWPFLALVCSWENDQRANKMSAVQFGVELSQDLSLREGIAPRALPLKPIWFGLVANTLIYAAVLYISVFFTFSIGRRIRSHGSTNQQATSRFRFKLRTFLVGIALLSLAFSYVYRAECQRQAVSTIQRNGGAVRYDFDDPQLDIAECQLVRVTTANDRLFRDYLHSVTGVQLPLLCDQQDVDLAARFPLLKELYIPWWENLDLSSSSKFRGLKRLKVGLNNHQEIDLAPLFELNGVDVLEISVWDEIDEKLTSQLEALRVALPNTEFKFPQYASPPILIYE